MRHITAIDRSELLRFLESYKEPAYRLRQIYEWIYKKGVYSFDEMLNLSKDLRERLKEDFTFSLPETERILTSRDGTQKFLLRFTDGEMAEAVAMREKGRLTLCLSTQIGCRQGCAFCVTGQMGFSRSLKHHEISDQYLVISHVLRPRKVTHIVIMGMGEPLDNYSHSIRAVKSLIHPEMGGISPKHITLSTVGIIPGIDRLGKENLGIGLAISLNAPTDKIRDALMPVNRRFPLADLYACLKSYPLSSRQRITIEYCLIRGINDSLMCARGLVAFLKGIKERVKVNLIPYNRNPLLPFCASTQESQERFQGHLMDHCIVATVRYSKGGDILAACGQLGYTEKMKGGGDR